jgi:hypothetical protein
MAENLWTTRPKPVQLIHIIAMSLTSHYADALQRAAKAL